MRVRFKRPDYRTPKYQKLRVEVFTRDGFRCVRCDLEGGPNPGEGLPYTGRWSAMDVVVDHIVALARGGTNDLSNLQTLCDACNLYKAGTEDKRVA